MTYWPSLIFEEGDAMVFDGDTYVYQGTASRSSDTHVFATSRGMPRGVYDRIEFHVDELSDMLSGDKGFSIHKGALKGVDEELIQ